MSSLTLHDGRQLVNIHPDGSCLGAHCPIHKPSDHPLKDAPMGWVGEIRHLVRICEHGFSHPDPDDIQFKLITGEFALVEAISTVHLMRENCDDCCQRKDV